MQEKRSTSDTENSTLINTEQPAGNQYVSSIADILVFLETYQLALRGELDAFDCMAEGGSGLFLSLSQKEHLLKCERVPTRENLADNCLAAALQMVLRDARDHYFSSPSTIHHTVSCLC